VVEYAVADKLEAAAIAVVLSRPVSSRVKPPEVVDPVLNKLATANSTVPALSNAITYNLDKVALIVPRVAVLGTTTEIAAETVRVFTVPLVIGVERKSKAQGLSVTVRALDAAEAVTE